MSWSTTVRMGKKLVVDGIFDELTLLLGVGSGKEEIRIIRKS